MSEAIVLSALLGLLGLAIQFALIYWAIRLALQHDRAFRAEGWKPPQPCERPRCAGTLR